MKPPPNAIEIEVLHVQALRIEEIPAFKRAKNEKCAECPQYVTSDDVTICAHQIVEKGEIKRKICRKCWGNVVKRAKYTAESSPWQIGDFVTK